MAEQPDTPAAGRPEALSSADARRLAYFCQRHAFDPQQVLERLVAWLAGETHLVRCAVLETSPQKGVHDEIAQRILHRHRRG